MKFCIQDGGVTFDDSQTALLSSSQQRSKKVGTSYRRPGKQSTPSKIVSRVSIGQSSTSNCDSVLRDSSNNHSGELSKKTPKNPSFKLFGSSKVRDEVCETEL